MLASTKNHLDQAQMSRPQITTMIICFVLNMLDGMDVLIISYTAPAIAKAWSIGPKALGIVFSAGLLGMTLGTLFLAPFADRIGRKRMILVSALLMGIFIFFTVWATSITHLMVLRFLSGIGIGCMLATTATLAAEYTPHRYRDFWVSLLYQVIR